MYILYVIYTIKVVVNKRIEKLYFMNWLGLGLGFRKVVHVLMLAVSDIRLTPLWLPQVLNQGLSHQCTCFSYMRGGALT